MSASRLATLSSAQKQAVARLFSGSVTARPVSNFVRIIPIAYAATPLSFGIGPSRFSPRYPAAGIAPPFGVIYGALDLATACYEAIIRDSLDISPSRILRPSSYATRCAVNFSTAPGQTLSLFDLTAGNAVRHGVPTDVLRYSHHLSGQFFSEFVHAEMPSVDGLLYASRFTENLCVAVYDRAIHKLVAPSGVLGLTRPLLASSMAPWNVRVV